MSQSPSDTITLIVPRTPPRELLVSMAMRIRHDFNVDKPAVKDPYGSDFACGMTPQEREVMLDDMERCYEEMTGQGFYKWDGSRDDWYRTP